ncbi:MAG: hypothetical protein JWL62_1484 [Hyphomicrobiales bacterium]|nr:hypothetical protein [Hyphomicrobiales bacterium]
MLADDGKLAAANAIRQFLREDRHRFLTVCHDEFLERSEQGRMSKAITFDPSQDRFGEGFRDVAQRGATFIGGGWVFKGGEGLFGHVGATLTVAVAACDKRL